MAKKKNEKAKATKDEVKEESVLVSDSESVQEQPSDSVVVEEVSEPVPAKEEAPKVRQSLNLTSNNSPPEPVVVEDKTAFDYKGIEELVKQVVETHFKGDKKLGFKAISNQLKKMLPK